MIQNTVIDISHYQTVASFATLHDAGIRGVIHKATQGLGYVDPRFKARVRPIRDAGLMHGAYHFGTGADGIAQAKFFLDTVQPDNRTLLALDFEPNTSGATMTLDQARAFVTHVHSETGRWPVFYSGNLIKEQLGSRKDVILANCPLWLAQYGRTATVPANWPTWTLWQYTDGKAGDAPHSVDGLGPCDRDKFNGDANGLRKLFGYPVGVTN